MHEPARAVPALLVAAVAILTLGLPATAAAQDVGAFQQALLSDLATLQQKYTSLAEAVPEEHYGWAPAEGVRAIGQVYAHVANGNYYFTGQFAQGRPDDVGIENAPGNLEEVTEKARILALLHTVFPHVREAIASTPGSKLDDEMTLFGQPSTVRGVMLLMMTHMHEHLGQSIAYARSVGVVPPWSS